MRNDSVLRWVMRRLIGRCGVGVRLAAIGVLLALMPATTAAQEKPEAELWLAGAYSFSDELGGFRIVSVTGKATRDDPIIITEELFSATPVTLTIRTTQPIRPFDSGALFANGVLYLRIKALNASDQGWVEFEFELQEILGEASVFGDGLSFDQKSSEKKNVTSDSFVQFSRDFEPYDKLLFRDGKVDPRQTSAFGFLITDFTPNRQFYLVQDPRIPSS